VHGTILPQAGGCQPEWARKRSMHDEFGEQSRRRSPHH
jgi:hypothetical protein